MKNERMNQTAFQRSRKRSFRKKKRRNGCLTTLILLIVLVGVGIYYIGAHSKQLDYARYPLRYEEQIIRNAQHFDLEPWHVAAVVRCESSFRTDALSEAGARGLMQIMPDTGEWLAGKFDEKSIYTDDMLYDGETNLKYGCWYLNWLMKRYEYDLKVVTAAYHAGHGTVDRWLDDPELSPNGKSLVSIPYDSTRTYVERVLNAYEKYRELYDFTAADDAA